MELSAVLCHVRQNRVNGLTDCSQAIGWDVICPTIFTKSVKHLMREINRCNIVVLLK